MKNGESVKMTKGISGAVAKAVISLLTIIIVIWAVACDNSVADAARKKSADTGGAYRLSRTSLKLGAGKKYRLKLNGKSGKSSVKGHIPKVKWSSTNKKAATVTSKGIVSAIKRGHTKIYAETGKKKYICKVNVTEKKRKATPSPTADPITISNIAIPTQAPVPAAEPVQQPAKRTPAPGYVVIHRGMTSVAPENSLPAFERAYEEGYRYMETDVRFTADNVPVLLHDERINRVSNGSGYIKDMTYGQVLEYDFSKKEYSGVQITKLESLVAWAMLKECNLYIEIKNEDLTGQQADIIYSILYKYNMIRRVSFISFFNEPLKLLMERLPGCRCGLLVYSYMHPRLIEMLDELNGLCRSEVFVDIKYRQAPVNDDNSAIADILNKKGYAVEGWTFSNPYEPSPGLAGVLRGYTTNL